MLGIGTVRCWCVFGAPYSTVPPTSVALSATVSRLRRKSTRRTRRAAISPNRRPGVRRQADDVAVLPRYVRQPLHLRAGEEPGIGAPGPGQRDAVRRVTWDAAVAHGESQNEREDTVRLPHRGGRETAGDELGHPR